MTTRISALLTLAAHAMVALADPLITPAAQLAPRATDPSLVGYISASGGFADVRVCAYPQTVSTSGSLVQCCSSTGPCPFYTACSGNTLLAPGSTVACDFDAASTCNTGIVLPTVGATGGPSFLGCWQKTLGSSAFTFVQDIGAATAAPAPTTTATRSGSGSGSGSSSGSSSRSGTGGASNTSSGSGAGSSPTTTSTRGSNTGTTRSTTAASASTTSTPNAAVVPEGSLSGVVGLVALLAQALL